MGAEPISDTDQIVLDPWGLLVEKIAQAGNEKLFTSRQTKTYTKNPLITTLEIMCSDVTRTYKGKHFILRFIVVEICT